MKASDTYSRRTFLKTGAGTFAAAAASSLPSFASPYSLGSTFSPEHDGTKRVLHIIGYSHIDAAWLWPWRDGSNLALTTFRSALDRMKETPGFCYSHSSSIHYQWVQKSDPNMFA